jgi:hypothetical protein
MLTIGTTNSRFASIQCDHQMIELLRLADLYELVHLKGACRESIQSTICIKNALDLLQLAVDCRVPELKKACINFIIVEHSDAEMQAELKKADLEPDLMKQIMVGISNYKIERQMSPSQQQTS